MLIKIKQSILRIKYYSTNLFDFPFPLNTFLYQTESLTLRLLDYASEVSTNRPRFRKTNLIENNIIWPELLDGDGLLGWWVLSKLGM